MRILSKRQVKEMVLYSPQHIARLEKAGQFPKRVQIELLEPDSKVQLQKQYLARRRVIRRMLAR